MAVLSRMTHHDETKTHLARRTAEGLSIREMRRCLKRHLARRLFKLLERTATRTPKERPPRRTLGRHRRPARNAQQRPAVWRIAPLTGQIIGACHTGLGVLPS
jgi:anti-sigma factor RsiW